MDSEGKNPNYEKLYREALPSLRCVRYPQASALCPFHEDSTPSLSVNLDLGVFHCFGCGVKGKAYQFKAMMAALQNGNSPLPAVVLSAPSTSEPQSVQYTVPPKTIRSFLWEDEAGNYAYKKRLDPRGFIWVHGQRPPKPGKGKLEPTLYCLPEVKQAECLVVVEGERDADTGNDWLKGLVRFPQVVATCTPNGAGDVKAEYLERMRGKAIVWISGDNDEAGEAYRQKIGDMLVGYVREIRSLFVPAGYKDWTEWKEAGGTAQEFLALLKAAPPFVPSVSLPQVPATIAKPARGGQWGPADMADEFIKSRGYRTSEGLLLRKHHKEWLRYDGKVYQPLDVEELHADIMRYIQGTAMRNKATETMVRNITKNIEAHCLIPGWVGLPATDSPMGWTHVSHVVAVENGLVHINPSLSDLPPVMLTPHDPNTVSRTLLRFAYDPDAECPRWKAFLGEILPDEDSRLLLQEIFGYCLTPGNPFQRFFMFEGSGGNGKGVVTNMLTRLLGASNVSSLPLSRFNSPHEVVAMRGKLLNLCTELKQADKVAEDILKAITGGDAIHYNPKYKDPFAEKPTAKIIMSTNERPTFTDRSDGLWRRLIILVFPVTIPSERQNRNLEEELAPELPGIFNWAIEGAVRLYRIGQFTNPESSRLAQEEFREETNPARTFLVEHYEVRPGDEVVKDELYQHYVQFCSDGGYRPLNKGNFLKEVARVFPESLEARAHNKPGQPRSRVIRGIGRRDWEPDNNTEVFPRDGIPPRRPSFGKRRTRF